MHIWQSHFYCSAITAISILLAVPAWAQDRDAAVAKSAKPGQSSDKVDGRRFGVPPADPAYGAFQRGYYLTALELALPRAEKGEGPALALIAEIYARGLGVAKDDQKAVDYYRRAMEKGVTEAQLQYALMLIDGKLVDKDEAQAEALLRKAAEADHPLAAFNLAQLIVKKQPGETGLREAAPWFLKAARAGVADAQYAVAQFYATGSAGYLLKPAKARRWMERAAVQNHDTAQVELGIWMVEGRGGPKDFESGYRWIFRAAKDGNVSAQVRLAKLLRTGIGVEPDSIKAAAWYILARRAGLKDEYLETFMDGLTTEEQQQAIKAAANLL